MTSIVDALPQEALDEIVDIVALLPFYSRRSLSSLLATSRWFQHRSRTHLYRKIKITDQGPDVKARLQRTVAMLQRNMDLACYVKEITVQYPLHDLALEKDNLSRQFADGQLLLAKLVGMLGRLLIVDVAHHPVDVRTSAERVVWNEMQPNVVAGLTSLVVERSADTLEAFRMTGVQKIPFSMLLPLRSLQNLDLHRSAITDDDGEKGSCIIPWRLKYLSTCCDLPCFTRRSTLDPPVCTQLTHLRLVFNRTPSYISGWNAIYAASETLVALVIVYHLDHCRPSANACDLDALPTKTFPNIQLLKVAVYPLCPESTSAVDMIAASPMFLCKCLRQCKFPRLQLLNICTEIWLQLTECATFASEGIIAKERWWAILANLLATNECLPSLSAVGLSLNTEILDDFAVVQDDELDAVHRGMANIVAQEIDGLFSDAYTTRGVTVGTTGVLMMMPQYDGIMKDFGFGSGISFH